MTLIKKTIIFLFLFASFSKVSGQVAPPPIAMPTDSNTLLIDKIIQVTNHEKYFIDYCSQKIIVFAKDTEKNRRDTKKCKVQIL